jgi:hypothetical protein
MVATPIRLRTCLRYLQVASGPVATAGAHFALSLFMLHALLPDAFGRIAFLLVLSQLGCGVWSALFCAPLPVLLAQDSAGTARRSMLAANLAGAAASSLPFACIALAVGMAVAEAFMFAGYAACYLLRWFARADAYTAGHPLRTTASDLAYSGVLLAGLAAMPLLPVPSLAAACALLMAAALAGMLPFGRSYLAEQFQPATMASIRAYAVIWRVHARWSLAGVLTTEATTNAHAYLLTLFLGPAAFAPVAASALLIRPIGVVVNALTEFERPRVARQIGRGDLDTALGTVRFFHAVLTLAWVVSALAAGVVLQFAPALVFPAGYDQHFLRTGTALWMAVALVRQWRAPGSALLQAGGQFRALAHASMASCAVSVVAVAVFLWFGGALLSIAGVLLGETVCTAWVRRQARLVMPDAAPLLRRAEEPS